MTSETNIFSFGENSDPIEKARAALHAVRQYQQDWQEHGVDRIHKYFDDVEGDWLENFEAISVDSAAVPIAKVALSDIVAQLKALGLSKSFIKNVAFPSWWRDDFEADQEAISRLLKSLARRLVLEVSVSQESNLLLDFAPISARKFKLQKKQENSELPELFVYLARCVASTVLEAVRMPYRSIPRNPSGIRELILKNKNSSCVSLEGLLDFCWSSGIPVIQFDLLSLFGKGGSRPKKYDGLVDMSKRRPVVVIGSSRKYSAWLLFILAHELGHIAHGHLQEGILSDESFKDGVNDEEEDAANQFATQLLFGDISPQWAHNLNQQRLLTKARCLGQEHSLDPGALILNYGWQTGNWGCAVAALNLLEPDANAPAQINTYYQRYLVSTDEESRDYLEQIKILAA